MKSTPLMATLLWIGIGLGIPYAEAIDSITCLQAKSKFKACAELSETEKFSLRDCLSADSGYADCRKMHDGGWHQRCLPAKSQYALCMNFRAMSHFTCVSADSGFKDCMEWEGDPLLCVNVKGGYGECRKRNKFLQHANCMLADSGYADCMNAGGLHTICMKARRSFQYCFEKDRQSLLFCAEMGKGYKECREAGFTIAHCKGADQGFADCSAYRDRD